MRINPADIDLAAVALERDPDWLAIAWALYQDRRFSEASTAFRAASLEHPHNAALLNNVADGMRSSDREVEALRILRTSLQADPSIAETWHNLGAMARNLGDFTLATAAYTEAARRWSDIRTYIGLADISVAMGDGIAGQRYAAQGLALKGATESGRIEARMAHSFASMQLGDFATAWESYEARLDKPEYQALTPADLPGWTPDLPSGSHVLVWREQGVGDEVRFLSCIEDVLALGYRCTIRCSPRLARTISRSFPVETTAKGEATPPGLDAHIAVGSLPKHLRLSRADFPDRPAYLVPDPERVAAFREFLDSLGPEPKLGISWRSGLLTTKRSLSYPQFEDLQALQGVNAHLVSLQYATAPKEIDLLERLAGITVVTPPDLDLNDDLDGVLALCAALDGVVSVGNAVAELAGAAGARTYQLGGFRTPLQFGYQQSPWHSRTTIFECSWDEPWAGPITRIAAAIATELDC